MDKALTTNVKIQNVIRQFHIIIDVPPVTPTSFFRILARQCPIVPAEQTKKSVIKCQTGVSKKTALYLVYVLCLVKLGSVVA